MPGQPGSLDIPFPVRLFRLFHLFIHSKTIHLHWHCAFVPFSLSFLFSRLLSSRINSLVQPPKPTYTHSKMKSASVLACIVPLVASLKYALPKSFAADSTCPFPENYTVEDFSTFTAAGSNDTTLSFNYVDEGTNITSFCQKNATSPNLSSSPYAAARYGCDNTNVKFIWQDSKLTILEAACPNTSE